MCHLSMYYPLPKHGDNALLQSPIMRKDTIEVSQSQRHLIIKLDHNYLCSTFIFKPDQIKFICTALSTKRSDKVLHTATKGICRQAFTLKHSTHPEIQSLQHDIEVPFKCGSILKNTPGAKCINDVYIQIPCKHFPT